MKLPTFLNKLNLKRKTTKQILLKKKVDIDPLKHWKQIIFVALLILVLIISLTIFLRYATVNNLLITTESKEKVEELQISIFKKDSLNFVINEFNKREKVRNSIFNPDLNIEEKSVDIISN